MFKKFFKKVKEIWKDLIGRSPRPEIPSDPVQGSQVKVALVVGHNSEDQGAINYIGESEYLYNSRIARLVQDRLARKDIGAAIVKRKPGVGYDAQVRSVKKQIQKLNPVIGICLHFNSYKKKAYGCEVLVTHGSRPGHANWDLADAITDGLNERLGLVERHQDGVKPIKANHGGSGMLTMLEDNLVTAVLVEPVFANLETRESKIFFEREDLYVEILAKAIGKYLK